VQPDVGSTWSELQGAGNYQQRIPTRGRRWRCWSGAYPAGSGGASGQAGANSFAPGPSFAGGGGGAGTTSSGGAGGATDGGSPGSAGESFSGGTGGGSSDGGGGGGGGSSYGPPGTILGLSSQSGNGQVTITYAADTVAPTTTATPLPGTTHRGCRWSP
jgi:hypothetical protein